MAAKKISELTAASALAGSEEMPVVQAGATVRATVSSIPVKLAVRTLTATATLAATDRVVLVDPTAGSVTVNLPTAAGNTGVQHWIKRTTGGANTVTIDPSGAQTIDGQATLAVAGQYDSYTLVSDGANWMIV